MTRRTDPPDWHPEPLEPGEGDAVRSNRIRRATAGAVAGVFTLSNVLHAAPCGDDRSIAANLCEPGTPIRHDPHIELGGSTSQGGGGGRVVMVALGTGASTSVATVATIAPGWILDPRKR